MKPPRSLARKPPSADDIVAIGEAVLAELGSEVQALVGDVAIAVEDWPGDDVLDELGIEDALDLTGLYCAVPVGERLAMNAPPSRPEMIFLYRLPILVEWCQRGCALHEVVFDVLTHEIGHHFGMDEAAVLRMEGRG
ncbi:MAG: metallopeptidase family protein [Geminicoccaceae bacterium]|nr:metallopeptidase family protein [Geminicoccaceae bacterium]